MTEMAAQIRLMAKNDTAQAFNEFERQAKRSADNAKKSFQDLSKGMMAAGVALSAFAVVGAAAVTKTTLLAARVQTLGVVMEKVGETAGYSTQQMHEFEQQVKDQGITTQVARTSLVRLSQANLDLSKATDLARIAQDAAVVAGINSSEAFERMIWGIQTLNPRILKTMGLTVSLQSAYSNFAKEQGITIAQIDMQTKKNIAMNEVMVAGEAITGVYAAAMDTAGKKLTSLPRLFEEAAVSLGNAFLPLFADLIDFVSAAVKGFNSLSEEMKQFIALTGGAATAIAGLMGPLLILGTQLPKLISSVGLFGSAFFSMGSNLAVLGTSAGFATTKLAMLAPGIGALGVAAVAAVALIALAAAIASVISFAQKMKTMTDLVDDSIMEHEAHMLETAETYDVYRTEMERIGSETGRWVGTQEELNAEMERLKESGVSAGKVMGKYKDAIIITSEAERDLTIKREGLIQAQLELSAAHRSAIPTMEQLALSEEEAEARVERLKGAIDDLGFLMGTDITGAVEDHTTKMDTLRGKYAETQEEIAALEERYASWVTWPAKATEEHERLNGTLGTLEGQIGAESDAWVRNSNMIIFNMAQRALSALPIDQQTKALAGLAEEMDLIDPATAAVWTRIGELTQMLADEELTVEGYADAVHGVATNLDEVPEHVSAKVEIEVTGLQELKLASELLGGEWTPMAGFLETQVGESPRGQEFQHGGRLAPLSKVGEKGFEYIVNGVVIPHRTSKLLERLGVFVKGVPGFALEEYDTSGGGGYIPPPQKVPQYERRDLPPAKSGTSGGVLTGTATPAGGVITSTQIDRIADSIASETAGITTQIVSAVTRDVGREITGAVVRQGLQLVNAISQQNANQQELVVLLSQVRDALIDQGTSVDYARNVVEGLQGADFG